MPIYCAGRWAACQWVHVPGARAAALSTGSHGGRAPAASSLRFLVGIGPGPLRHRVTGPVITVIATQATDDDSPSCDRAAQARRARRTCTCPTVSGSLSHRDGRTAVPIARHRCGPPAGPGRPLSPTRTAHGHFPVIE
jgi:hypothetical protein